MNAVLILLCYCEYRSMVRFGDVVNIHISLSELKSMSMVVNYQVLDSNSGEVRALGKTRHCFYDRNKQRPISLKKAVPELYGLISSMYIEGQVK